MESERVTASHPEKLEARPDAEHDEDDVDTGEAKPASRRRVTRREPQEVRAYHMPAALPLAGVAALIGLVGLGLLLAARRAAPARNAGLFSGWGWPSSIPVPHTPDVASLPDRVKRALHLVS
jgi:hypothetical protein